MAFGEVFPALETKAIDGQENPFVTIDTSKFHEVRIPVDHEPLHAVPRPLLEAALGQALRGRAEGPAGLRRHRARRAAQGLARAVGKKSLANLKKAGMQVNELPAAERARLREAVKPVYERHAATIGPETVAKMQESLAQVRKQ